MAGELTANWEERVRTIASNLLTLEVNTVVKNGMVAQKMPEVPVALHAIVQDYASFVAERKAPVTRLLLVAAAGRLADRSRSAAYLAFLRHYAFPQEPETAWPGDAAAPPDNETSILTNGAETFEALIWAAASARERVAREDSGADPARRVDNQRQAALLTRIEDNSRQLREVAILLETGFSSHEPTGQSDADAAKQAQVANLQTSTRTYAERLKLVMHDPAVPAADPETRVFGGTVDQTTQALFRHPRPALSIDPDLTVLIRKAWDIGLEEVRFQTVIQVDGDVLVRVAEMPPEDRDFLASLHRTAVNDGMQQWRLLFKVVGDLVQTLGQWLFGRSSAVAPAPSGAPAET